MDLLASNASHLRFQSYVAELASVIGHVDRVQPLSDYCTGLLLPGERKSVEPMAALTAPGRTAAQHQSLLHFVAQSPWSDQAVLSQVPQIVLPGIEAHGAIEAWIIDDTGFPKKGRHSVGVARQYCGQLGKQDNCQAVVSLSIANHHGSLPVAHRLYLPQAWVNDKQRRTKAGIPPDVVFQTKPAIALDQIGKALDAGLPPGIVLADAGYGNDSKFRDAITALGMRYCVGIQSNLLLWKAEAVPPPRGSRGGRPSHQARRAQQVSAKELALGLPSDAWQTIPWRVMGDPLTSRFARLRVRPAGQVDPSDDAWLMIEWPKDEAEPTRYWLSTMPADTDFETMVDQAKLRWRIERDYQDLKQELGLGHYEGRGWRGLHHHITLCIAAYGFLIAERSAFPPTASGRPQTSATAVVSSGDRSKRPAFATRTASAKLNDHAQAKTYHRSGQQPAPLSLLRCCW